MSIAERAKRARRTLIAIAQRRQRRGSGSMLTTLRERSARVQWPNLSQLLAPLPWAVVGAVATRLYMPERTTGDMDIVVLARHAQEVRRRLGEAGFSYRGELSIGGSSWTSPDGVAVDVIEGEEPWWPQALSEAATNRDAQGLPVLPLPYLVLMKLRSGRVQDIADVTRMLGQAPEEALDSVRSILNEHAPDLIEDLESLIELGRLELQEGPSS